MKIVAAGASGFVGGPLCAALIGAGHSVTILSRQPERARQTLPAGVTAMGWDPRRVEGAWVDAVGGADALVNLAGESIASERWSTQRKARLVASRLESTGALVQAIEQAPGDRRPKVLVNASAIGYYGDRGDEALTEESPAGQDFLGQLCLDWETAARRGEAFGVRVVTLRLGLVVGPGGALEVLARPFRFFAGGPVGSGRQWVSWIHVDDVAHLILFALEQESVSGPLNGTTPNPVRMRDLAATVGQVLHRPSWAPVPAFVLRIALGELADALLLRSQHVLPTATLAAGYEFRHPDLQETLRSVL